MRGKKKAKKNLLHVHIGHEEIMNCDPHSLIEPLWWTVSLDGVEKYNETLREYTLPQRYALAVEWYITEVNNGGHAQFYANSTGIVYPDALQGLKEIGHQEAFDILKASIARFGEEIPLDRLLRNDLLERMKIDFEDLDSTFYVITDLDDKMMEYIRIHEADFYFDGDIIKPEW